jgi:hypothetical protein
MDCDWWARLDPSVACCVAYVSYSKLAYATKSMFFLTRTCGSGVDIVHT